MKSSTVSSNGTKGAALSSSDNNAAVDPQKPQVDHTPLLTFEAQRGSPLSVWQRPHSFRAHRRGLRLAQGRVGAGQNDPGHVPGQSFAS